MKGILLAACALLLVPSLAMAVPETTRDTHFDFRGAVLDPRPDRFDFTCSTGDAASLVAGIAALGLVLGRRR